MRELAASSWDADVLESPDPVVVDFWAPWCRPCRSVDRILEELETRHAGQVRFVKVDVDAQPELAARYGVLSLPTVILFAEGAARETVVGARSRAHFERAFSGWLGAAA